MLPPGMGLRNLEAQGGGDNLWGHQGIIANTEE